MAKIGINTDSLKAGRDWKRHKVVDGINTFRFLPPFGDPEVHNGYPYRKWSTIWLIDPTSGKRKPFASPYCAGEDKCPVKEYADLLATKLEDIASEMKAAGSSEEDIKARLAPARSEQWRLKLNHTFAYNATDKSGTVGLLEIKKTAHDGVKAAMSKYIKDYSQDPTTLSSEKDDSGIWMNINREGLGKDTKYTVEFNSMMVNHPELGKVRKDDRSPLSENVVNNYDSLGYDLSSIYSIKTYDELKNLLVANLKLLAKNGNDKFNSIPDLIIPEFMNVSVQETQAEAVSEPVAEPASEPAVPQGKKPVTLNLGGDDEGEDAPVNTTVKAQVNNTTVETVATTAATSDDIFAMADEFLND